MTANEKYFFNLNYSPVHLLEALYKESQQDQNYYRSPVDVLRCDVSSELRLELAKLFSIPFKDCGFLKTIPNSKYPVHKDVFRQTAVNMPMFEFNPSFKSFVVSPKGLIDIDYTKDTFSILNVMEYHGVINSSLDEGRIVLSMGFKDHSYADILKMHQCGAFLNAV